MMLTTIRKREKQILRRVKRLIQEKCADYVRGSCLANDGPCDAVHSKFATIHNGAIPCDYFLRSVLPSDPEMHSVILHEIYRQDDEAGEGMKDCARCHKPFIPACNRQKYCTACGEEAKRVRIRLKQRRYRERKKIS